MELGHYHFDSTSFFASRYDQRFSYCLQVPAGYRHDDARAYPLAVVVHGTERRAEGLRDAFRDFAEKHECIVLAPLFPCGIGEAGELNNYKWLAYDGIRFDRVLLDMVAEVEQLYRVDAARFMLYGFSGGGHFAHRFLYVHPERLRAVSIGAPGIVTLLDFDRNWWVGVHDFERVFGKRLNLDAVRDVAVQLVIGGEDTETWEIGLSPGDAHWMPGADAQGANRLQRMEALKQSLRHHGVSVRHDVVPGVGHDGFKMIDAVESFFAGALDGQHPAAGRPLGCVSADA